MLFVGIDPSFSKTGVCYLDTEDKTIKFVAISPPGNNEDYKQALDRSAYIALNIIKHLGLKKQCNIIFEEPLLSSQKASRLGILSGVLAWSLAFTPTVKKLSTISPAFVARFNKPVAKAKGLDKKDASRFVAHEVINYLANKLNYEIEIYNDKINKDGSMKHRMLSHDEAEAFIMMLALMSNSGFFSKDELKDLILINQSFAKKHNILNLIDRME